MPTPTYGHKHTHTYTHAGMQRRTVMYAIELLPSVC